MTSFRCLSAVFALVVLVGRAGELSAQKTVIHAERLVDPASGEATRDRYIVVEGDRIVSVSGTRPVDGAGDIIELPALTVLPGLIDAHVHLVIGGPVRDNASATLGAGFTTIVDLGARTTRLLPIRDSMNAGAIRGPHLLAAGIWVGTRGGVCEFNGVGIAGGPDAFRARVRENLEAGADVIKVCMTGWPATAHANPSEYEIADAALDAAVAEAHAGGRLVVAHAISAGGVRAALRAGVDGLAHAAYIDESIAAQMRERGMFLIPTLASLTSGDTSVVARDLVAAVGIAHRAGVPLVFGTDGGVLPHGDKAAEFAALGTAGLSPLEALRAATLGAARAFHLADSVGVIAPGMVADLIAVEGDPLRDLTAFRRVRFVMARGRVVVRP